ncbi:MAG: hypothetical protein AMJ72_06390 [Acidithiobacillales bacterium SM1_46]|nr:MAG: hypothetical protein AMJ72_06390 [Acidithiobacillales bacterium SM1_46]
MRRFITEPLAEVMAGGLRSILGIQAHAGGIVGRIAARRTVPALAFAAAPRLHGGLAADEFPAILQRGETVLPRGAAGGNIVINIHNQTGMPMQATQPDVTFDGERWIVGLILKNYYKGGELFNLIGANRR